jgi:hypothetical protein
MGLSLSATESDAGALRDAAVGVCRCLQQNPRQAHRQKLPWGIAAAIKHSIF